jgi:hypothetical protein
VALLLAFPAYVNDPRKWWGQPSNLIHGLTIAEFATTCGTLHALPVGKWLETEHSLIGNAGNSKAVLTPKVAPAAFLQAWPGRNNACTGLLRSAPDPVPWQPAPR